MADSSALTALGPNTSAAPFPDAALDLKDLRELSRKDAMTAIEAIATLEKKNFPKHEAFNFQADLLSKPHYVILIARLTHDPSQPVIGYVLCARQHKAFLLHKICVDQKYRGKKVGKRLLNAAVDRAKSTGSRVVELWVDEARHVARQLYDGLQFREMKRIEHYYATDRHGIKMVLDVVP